MLREPIQSLAALLRGVVRLRLQLLLRPTQGTSVRQVGWGTAYWLDRPPALNRSMSSQGPHASAKHSWPVLRFCHIPTPERAHLPAAGRGAAALGAGAGGRLPRRGRHRRLCLLERVTCSGLPLLPLRAPLQHLHLLQHTGASCHIPGHVSTQQIARVCSCSELIGTWEACRQMS